MPSRPIRRSFVLLALAVLALGIRPDTAWSESGVLPRRVATATEDPTSARVIVKYRADSTLMRALSVRSGAVRPAHAGALSLRLGLALTDGRTLGDRTQSLRASGLSSSQLAAQLAAQPDVEWAVPDRRRRATALSDDPLLPPGQTAPLPAVGQWYLRAPDNTIVSAVNAVGAWDVTTGSPAVTVAMLDTGVRFDHPDLAAKLYPGYDFVQDAAPADDNQPGRDNDANDPGDWTTLGQCSPGEAAADSSWHGTQVAGLIGAATNNAAGMAGIGRNLMLLPIRVLGRCGGFDSDIIAGLRWAAGVTSEVGFGASVTLRNDHPAKVINMSLGSVGSCEASYRDAFAEVKAAGVTVVVAAGNENGLAVNSPANCPGVIAVAGVRHAGTKVGYSSIGPEVSIAAPAGNCVNESTALPCLFPLLTTTNSGTTVPVAADNSFSDGTSERASLGTSFSAPLVAGAVGLVLSVNPALTPDRVKAVLQANARAFPSSGSAASVAACHAPDGVEQLECYCTTTTCGAGLLDAFAAVSRALDPAASITASTTTPTVGDAVTLDGSASLAYANRAITNYQWTITAGAAFASFSGATNRSVATLNTSSAGNVTVQLVVTDSTGATATSATSVTVAPPAPPAPATGSSGGGAVDLAWVLVLAGAVAALRLLGRFGGVRDKRPR